MSEEKKKVLRWTSVQLFSRYIHILYSNSVVSIDTTGDEFALLRTDSYQLALLISKR